MSAGLNAGRRAIAALVSGRTSASPPTVDMGSEHYLDSPGIVPDRAHQGFPLVSTVC
jgi:hypothetical protein